MIHQSAASASTSFVMDDNMYFVRGRRSRRRTSTIQPVQTANAFEEMVRASRPKFVAAAYSILQNQEDAEDAVQNALISAYVHLREFEGRAALKTWFTRIVLNAALMLRRKRPPSRFVSLTDPDASGDVIIRENISAPSPDPEKAFGTEETLRRIDAQLAKMRPVLREAFTIAYYGEMSNEEASRALHVPIGTFKARLFRARRLVLKSITARKKAFGVKMSFGHNFNRTSKISIERMAA